jgi:uncharacterized protein YegP (UPF0339 family)
MHARGCFLEVDQPSDFGVKGHYTVRAYPYRGIYHLSLVAPNGKTIADSGEGYVNQRDCINGIRLVRASGRATVSIVK